jgi:hypothetical protein
VSDATPAVCVVDTNVLLNLATPVVDDRDRAPGGADPLKTVLASYDVHVPGSVLGEVTETTGSDDLLSAAADLVLRASRHLTVHEVERSRDPVGVALDRGEADAVALANELAADLLVTDEFGSTNYLFVSLALADRNTPFTTPHLLCALAGDGLLPVAYVEQALSYYAATKGWDQGYLDQLRRRYLRE